MLNFYFQFCQQKVVIINSSLFYDILFMYYYYIILQYYYYDLFSAQPKRTFTTTFPAHTPALPMLILLSSRVPPVVAPSSHKVPFGYGMLLPTRSITLLKPTKFKWLSFHMKDVWENSLPFQAGIPPCKIPDINDLPAR